MPPAESASNPLEPIKIVFFGLGAVGSALLICLAELAERDEAPVRFVVYNSVSSTAETSLQLCFRDRAGRDRTLVIDAERVDLAKETLIQRRDTHLDQLADKLDEPRVRRVIEPILAGDCEPERLPTDDVQYVRDLGLITTDGQIEIANRDCAQQNPGIDRRSGHWRSRL